ncbi:MAG: thymidine phosphorylase [Clostridia bacterium]|nr:thymidine phosphorylase [Clostridia bacterium]
MRMYDLITKKKQGGTLSETEIREMIAGFTEGTVPDYQMAAMAMAIYFQGMTREETAWLTDAMAHSGDTVDLSMFGKWTADKHSTGGVGDKTTLIVAPIVAACGLKVAKMSGRGLGHTGGTVDKLESIEGYRSSLSQEEFLAQVERVGLAVIGQTGNLTPADKKLYALRDVTATVDSIPLIVSSIMSKKLAAGSQTIVLDVKAGSGAFMRDGKSAGVLAREMVAIGKACGRKMAAFVTNMDVPLGKNIGNSLEVIEAIGVLKGEIHGDLRTLCLHLAAAMISLGLEMDFETALQQATACLEEGRAFEKFTAWIEAQGGNVEWVRNPSQFPGAAHIMPVRAERDGYIALMNTEQIGLCAGLLGAGRVRKEDAVDFAAGIVLRKKTGDYVQAGDVLAELHTNIATILPEAEKCFQTAVLIQNAQPEALPLIMERID